MTDFIILILSVLSVIVFLKTVKKDFSGNGKTSCGGSCEGCQFQAKCKEQKK